MSNRIKRATLFICVLFAACGGSTNSGKPTPSVFEDIIPLPRIGGGRLSGSDFDGKVVVLDFWASWCQPCLVSLPRLVAMQEEYKADGLLIVGVTMQSDPVLVQTLIAKHGISYPLVVGNNKTIETYGLTGFPTVVVVGRDGAVVQVFDGMPQPGALRQTIAPLLAERTPA